ncbi:predicted protein [Naegleria gruberi]|uniref:Predicted protein n=1 Tax=Naegleria gruberi TaxID=5762 RepID=D2VGY8_NAEGR|nr:uncharacterized protein NAEGRDRAFT_68215 [Naegleria gruberi]EFC43800.1 predicted protein [Naegleria gruberi]|eukprot:XP_002676544.1 predicted protein [Naegleria gruberi strain NEG-M]
MQDDNIEGFTLDSSLIDDSPLIEEYLSNFSSTTIVSEEDHSPPTLSYYSSFQKQTPSPALITATNIPTTNTTISSSTDPTSPKRIPSLREKLQVLVDKAHEKKKSSNNLLEEEDGAIPSSPPSQMISTVPSKVEPLIVASNLSIEKTTDTIIEANNIERENDLMAEQVEDPTTANTKQDNTQKPLYNRKSNKQDYELQQAIQKELATSAAKMAANLPPKSKPELNRAKELKKMDEQYHFEGYKNIEESQHYHNDDDEEEQEDLNDSIHRDEDEEFHNQLNADISLIEEDKKDDTQYNSFTVEEEKLELSDEEGDLTGRAMEDLTVSKLEASTTSVDQSLTLSSLTTPVRTSSPLNQRARPNSSMRSSTPSYMNSTRASISKEISRASVDLRSSASDMRMRFGMINYQQRPPPANRSPSPNIVQKRRVTPRKERIYNIVPALHFEDISVTTGLGTISVPNYRLTSLKGLGVKRDLKILYLQNNYLASFNHLETQPNLEVLYVANNCISSFFGFKTQPKLTLISLEGNPITKHPHYRLMTLIVCGSQLKKIDGEMVQYKEREFVKHYLSANERAVEAIRSGWLMDPKPRTNEEFQDIIRGLLLQNFDDRESIRNTQSFKDLVSGALAKTTPAVDLNDFEEKKKIQHKEEIQSPDLSHGSSGGFNSAFLTNYINEIKQLKGQLEKKAEELKEEKQKYKDLKESSIGIDELNLLDKTIISNIAVSLNSTEEIVENVTIAFTLDTMEISTTEEILRDIEYEAVTRTSLLVDEQKLFRVHIRMNTSELLDIITSDKKQSLSIYKILHMKVAHANKQKKLRQQANK